MIGIKSEYGELCEEIITCDDTDIDVDTDVNDRHYITVYYYLFTTKVAFVSTRKPLSEPLIEKIKRRKRNLIATFQYHIKKCIKRQKEGYEVQLTSKYLEQVFKKKCVNNQLLGCGDFNFTFNPEGILIDYNISPNFRVIRDDIKIWTLDKYMCLYLENEEGYLYEDTFGDLLDYNIFEMFEIIAARNNKEFDSEDVKPKPYNDIVGLFCKITNKLAYIIERNNRKLSKKAINNFIKESELYNGRSIAERVHRELETLQKNRKIIPSFKETIRQSFVEERTGCKCVDNKIKTKEHIFFFEDGYIVGCEEIERQYTYKAKHIFGDFINVPMYEYYEQEAQTVYDDMNDVVGEINLMADCLEYMQKNQYSEILNSENTLKAFGYNALLANYIALAAYFTDKDITQKQLIDSTHRKYEYISKETIGGVEIVKIKAYGKIFKFYNGHTQEIEGCPVSSELSDGSAPSKVHEGYVYVLINPSMEGLVKIGKTTKDPKERAKELSSATGVATPFIVAYYKAFSNCDEAERMIHKQLEAKGVRYNSNREFFEIETCEAVEIVSSLADTIHGSASVCKDDDNAISIDTSLDEEELFELGKENYDNENYDEALVYFQAASDKGSIVADRYIGWTYSKQGKSDEMQMEAYERGLDKGDLICAARLAFKKFCIGEHEAANLLWDWYIPKCSDALDQFGVEALTELYLYAYAHFKSNIEIKEGHKPYILLAKSVFESNISPRESAEEFYEYLDSLEQ